MDRRNHFASQQIDEVIPRNTVLLHVGELRGGLKPALCHVARFQLKSGNSIETDRLRQAFNITEAIQGSIGIDAKDTDSAGS